MDTDSENPEINKFVCLKKILPRIARIFFNRFLFDLNLEYLSENNLRYFPKNLLRQFNTKGSKSF